MQPVKFLRLNEVLRIRGRGHSAHYTDLQNGTFVPPVAIGERARGYPEHEVAAIQDARLAGHSDDQIRQLVADLTAARSGPLPARTTPTGKPARRASVRRLEG